MTASSPPLSEDAIPADVFRRMRDTNLARWPTGASVDFDEALRLLADPPLEPPAGTPDDSTEWQRVEQLVRDQNTGSERR